MSTRVPGRMALNKDAANCVSNIEHSSTTTASYSSGCCESRTNLFLCLEYSSNLCIVMDCGLGIPSGNPSVAILPKCLAALAVGDVKTIFLTLPIEYHSLNIDRVVKVLPVPGPPVKTNSCSLLDSKTACCCSVERLNNISSDIGDMALTSSLTPSPTFFLFSFSFSFFGSIPSFSTKISKLVISFCSY